ncbi:MAG TPA: hypothetical protein DD381_13070, partial [Lentisphaeria bacterium]|nr:hypothetical protein [Lentisphaeria bacterium]
MDSYEIQKREDSLFCLNIVISASFTPEPIKVALKCFLSELGINCNVEFSSYNQIFQELLVEASKFHMNESGINIILFSLTDWVPNSKIENKMVYLERLKSNINSFLCALENYKKNRTTKTILCLCPSIIIDDNLESKQEILELESSLLAELKLRMKEDYILSYNDVLGFEDFEEIFNYTGYKEGHISYTSCFYNILGMFLARRVYALIKLPYKVLVVDCDNTLWKGVCGESENYEIEIDTVRRDFQNKILDMYTNGILICLCSKNTEEDVFKVFEQNKEMVLRKEHLANWKINWNAKSKNIYDLATELNLGLDSFIFIDDNPVECAEIRSKLPEVLTLNIPKGNLLLERFLKNVWAFDVLTATDEDKIRTKQYRDNIKRENIRKEHFNFEEFIKELELKILVEAINFDDIPRVAQLTQRVNQFNSTTIRRSEDEIKKLLYEDGFIIFTVKVNDRFGDYGLVGAIIGYLNNNDFVVESFVLSCRILGKGVEHKFLREVGHFAKSKNINNIKIDFAHSGKNIPIFNFLKNIKNQNESFKDNKIIFSISVDDAVNICFNSKQLSKIFDQKPITKLAVKTNNRTEKEINAIKAFAEKINSIDEVNKFIINSGSRKRENTFIKYVKPRNNIEKLVAENWQNLLSIEKIGLLDDFFKIGGDSILGIQLSSRLSSIGLPCSPKDIINAKTIEKLVVCIKKNQSVLEKTLIKDLHSMQVGHDDGASFDPFPMSDIQKAYLIGRGASFEIGNIANHSYNEYKYQHLDIELLNKVINKIIHLVPELTLTFNINTLTQCYSKNIPQYSIKFEDLSGKPESEVCNILKAKALKLSRQVYDTTNYPLFDFQVTKTSKYYILHISIDLILLDVDSRIKLFNLIHCLYNDISYKPEIYSQVTFRDYMVAYESLKSSLWYDEEKAYWEKRLSNYPDRPKLSLLMNPEDIIKPTFKLHTLKIEKTNWLNFKEQAFKYGVSPSSVIMTLFGLVIKRWSSNSDFLLTLTLFNRLGLCENVEKLYGDFTSTIVYDFEAFPDKTFLSNVEFNHKKLWEDVEHSNLISGVTVQKNLIKKNNLNPQSAVSPIVFTARKQKMSFKNNQTAKEDIWFLDKTENIDLRVWNGQTSQAWIDLQAVDCYDYFESTWMYVEELFDEKTINDMNFSLCKLIKYFS